MRIEVASDMICTWCYLGGRRLALSGAQEPAVFERAFAELVPPPGGPT